MRTHDLSPLFRSTVGFDRMTRLLETALQTEETGGGYPPYNIEKLGDDQYRVTLAVAGFRAEDIEITALPNQLVIKGRQQNEDDGATYLHRGIAGRAFDRRFQLADHIKVTGADLRDGLLHVDLVREVPEAMKPRTIAITTAKAPTAIMAGNA